MGIKLNIEEARNTAIQLVKYGIIGVMNTVITLVAFYLLNTILDLPYGVSNIAAYVLGMVNSFVWNRTWVFKTGVNIRREAVLFGCGFVLCWMLQGVVSWILLEGVGMKNLPNDVIPFFPMEKAGQNLVMLIAMVTYTIANYAYNRFVTFAQKTECDKSQASEATL